MSGQPLVSVIVPVYNVEPYVGQCIESLIGQTLEELEIILVNDGSTDGSLGLLRKAEAIDSRVRVIDKPNGGYGAAVNRGLDEARGKYVAIAEPDDFVDAHMYEDLYGAARQADGAWADVVKGSYWNYYDGNGAPGGWRVAHICLKPYEQHAQGVVLLDRQGEPRGALSPSVDLVRHLSARVSSREGHPHD